MHLESYCLNELKFAYLCHVYYRWHTHWNKPRAELADITPELIEAERPDVRVLQLKATDFEVALLASLRPTDSVATGASKTWNRQGTFSVKAAEAVADYWERAVDPQKVHLEKVSFVPDHVHLAIRTHPSVVPAELSTQLLNVSQDVIRQLFPDLLIATGNPRMWKPSAYIGTYGDLARRQIRAYLQRWREGNGKSKTDGDRGAVWGWAWS